jgi:hypothetical protein
VTEPTGKQTGMQTGKQTGQQAGRRPAERSEPAESAVQPLTRLPDGTVKQVNPVTGTKVWTLPGRGARPLGLTRPAPLPLDPADHDRHCAFCAGRLLETTPEIARLVRDADGWREIRGLTAEQLDDTVPQFRRFPNLF